MKNSKVVTTLSFKVRHQAVLISDQSKDTKLLFTGHFLSFVSSLKPFFGPFLFLNEVSCLKRIKRTHILKNSRGDSFQGKPQAHDYRLSNLRSCHLFFRKQTKYKMVRPLLDFKRESITMVCKDFLLSVYPDKSNRLLQYSRNRIRKQIIPSIKYFLNPQVENSLFKIADVLRKEKYLTSSLLKTVL